ncbi:MAG TPA: AAA family ATPase [Candidatus Sulfotelmatobacter sp.]|nr:AAA family ATPase [Candidatus Sulfotelmatobacter sp.]
MNTTETETKNGMENTPENKEQAAVAESKAKWHAHFERTISCGGLGGIVVPPRDAIIGKWFKKGDLGFICGPRGSGKTWLAMFLARKCAEGGGTGAIPEWNIHGPRRVLYVDGEMPWDGSRERDLALAAAGASGLFYLQHEALFHHTGDALNLAEPGPQAALLDRCRRDRIEILFLDNLSCLFYGMRENDADAWERVLPWLLDLRRNRIAVVFVAHTGRNGLMRGTSRREDAAFWIINLSELIDVGDARQGARFVTKFIKNRNGTEADCPTLEWRFIKAPNDPKMHISCTTLSVPLQFRQCIEDGLVSATDIAARMGISKGHVSKHATKAIKDGWLRKKGRQYALTSEQPMAEWIRRVP